MGSVQVSRLRVTGTVHTASLGSQAVVNVGTQSSVTHRGTASGTAAVSISTQTLVVKQLVRGAQASVNVGVQASLLRKVTVGSQAVMVASTQTLVTSARRRQSQAAVQVLAQAAWSAPRLRGSTASVLISTPTGIKPKNPVRSSQVVVRVGTQVSYYFVHPKTANRGSQASVLVSVQTSADHPKSVYGLSFAQPVVVQTETGFSVARLVGSQADTRIGNESAATKFYDRTLWRDISVTAELLPSRVSAALLDSRWSARLEQPMRISELTTDYLVVRIELDVPVNMSPPFIGLARDGQGLPTEWFQAAWRGNSTPVARVKDRFYRLAELLAGPESDGQTTSAGTWGVYYDLRDLPTRSVERAGTLLVTRN